MLVADGSAAVAVVALLLTRSCPRQLLQQLSAGGCCVEVELCVGVELCVEVELCAEGELLFGTKPSER